MAKTLRVGFVIRWLWVAFLATAGLLAFDKAASGLTRVATLALAGGLAFTVLVVSWRRAIPRLIVLAAITVAAAILVYPWPIRTAARQLREECVARLKSFEGCPYFWGGECRRGIDCSGLVRRGMQDACLRLGVVNLDPGLLRRALSVWWNDSSARDMGAERQGLTTVLYNAPSIQSLDDSRLLPGDMAVAADGIHVLAYLGDGAWIQADPSANRVIVCHAQSTTNAWFQGNVSLLRWTWLK